MKNKYIFTALALTLALAGTGHADTLAGKVKEIDTKGNTLTLTSAPDTEGRTENFKIVWDGNRADLQALENASLDDFLSVDAEKNMVTQNWNANAVRSGVLAEADNAVRSDARLIRGDVRSIDVSTNVIVLASSDKDEQGRSIEYRVVWDDASSNVREGLEKAKVGDTLSLSATQNKITRNWKAVSLPGVLGTLGEGDQTTLTGEVVSVDAGKNAMVLRTIDPSGKVEDRKIVWSKDFRDQSKLENAKIGERLSVRADQNFLTRNWNVKSLS